MSEEMAASIMDESPGFHVVDAPPVGRADASQLEVAQRFGGDGDRLLSVREHRGEEQAQREGEEATQYGHE